MLVRLTSKQISDHWKAITPALKAALPPTTFKTNERMNNILRALLKGQMQCWVWWGNSNGDTVPKAVAVTTVTEDACSAVRNLLIYAIFAWKMLEVSEFTAGIETLKKFARGLKCHRIVAYTNEAAVVQLAKRLGGRSEFTFLTFEVDYETPVHDS